MHIPDNYLSPSTCGVFGIVMIPVWVHSIRKISRELDRKKIAFIGVAAAFSFLLMMFNVPLPGGTTGHAVGGTLIAILLGPEASCLAITVALALQALIFGDGGILSFGVNCFNMAFVLPFVGYAAYDVIRKHAPAKWGDKVGAIVGSYLGINVAALCAAIEFGVQPYLFRDGAGQALYCPYPLAVSIPAMMIPHLLVAGVIEALATVLIYQFVKSAEPDFIYHPLGAQDNSEKSSRMHSVHALIAVLCVATPLGLLAGSGDGWLSQFGDAWGEWGVEDLSEMIGYTPAGMENGFEWNALMPDYTLEGLPDVAAYILSAVIGVALLIIIFRIIASAKKDKPAAAQ
jgi:cobalt/nickel transport system permease protein